MKTKFGILAIVLLTCAAHAQNSWTNLFNGPGNDDEAAAIAVDSDGNVFVTGFSWPDYATIKYSNGGTPLWTNFYDGPVNGIDEANAIAVDGSNNVIVTGESGGGSSGYDYATVKYSSTGVPLWTNRYNGPGNADDIASAVATDTNGNVFVTGWSTGSGTSYDYATVAYSSGGVPLWTNRYNDGETIAYTDYARAIVVDANGNVLVTGQSPASSSANDYATIAYSNGGTPLWTNRYNGPLNGTDAAYAIAADHSGNVFVTGYSYGLNSGGLGTYDYATVAYSSAGVSLWTNRYDGSANQSDQATAIGVDGNGNVFVTGGSDGYGTGHDYATIAYANGGTPLWTNFYNGPKDGGNNAAQALAIDKNGNVFVTGQATLTNGYAFPYATIGYSRSGVPLWTNLYSGGPTSVYDNHPRGIAVDSQGNVFVTGRAGNTSLYDYATIKYGSSSISPIRLGFQLVGGQLVLNWGNVAFSLQSAPTVTGTFTNITGAISPYTNSITAGQQFFRLISN